MQNVVKILHFTTHDEECGIAKYQEQFLAGMRTIDSVENEVFPYSPNKTKVMSAAEFKVVLEELLEKMRTFDILHIQHELSFYKHDELKLIIPAVRNMGKKVIVTVHTSPDVEYSPPRLKGISARSMVHYARESRRASKFKSIHITGIQQADLVLVHNSVTATSLESHGVSTERIKIIRMPVPAVDLTEKSQEITKRLRANERDIIFCTVGFLSETKGIKQAVKALSILPANYKLAIIGGAHPSGTNHEYYDDVSDLIATLGLQQRTYITGYVKEDNKLNALIRECDICVYPYQKKYYDGVTSAAINNAFANYKPAVAYPTASVIEMTGDSGAIVLCKSFNYYELVRSIEGLDIVKQIKLSIDYATSYSYEKESKKLAGIYVIATTAS